VIWGSTTGTRLDGNPSADPGQSPQIVNFAEWASCLAWMVGPAHYPVLIGFRNRLFGGWSPGSTHTVFVRRGPGSSHAPDWLPDTAPTGQA